MMKSADNALIIRTFIAGYSSLSYQLVFYYLASIAGLTEGLAVAITLTSSVLVAGIGSLLGSRLFRSPRIPECAMGTYCLVLFLAIAASPNTSLTILLSIFPQPWNSIPFLLLTAVPYFLAGSLLPLYARQTASNKAFGDTYFWFHSGAAGAFLLIEFFVIAHLGWLAAGGCLAIISILNSLAPMRDQPATIKFRLSKPSTDCPLSFRGWHIFLASILTGYTGILFYSTFNSLIGAWIHNYSVATAFIFIGLAASGVIAKKWHLTNETSVACAIVGVCMLHAITVSLAAYPGAAAFSNIYIYYLIIAAAVTIPTFALIGIYVPAFVHNGFPSGRALFLASLGNFTGYWVYVFSATYNASILVTLLLVMPLVFRPSAWGRQARSKYAALAYCILVIVALPTLDLRHLLYETRFAANADIKTSRVVSSWNTYGWSNDIHEVTLRSSDKPRLLLSIAGYTSLDLEIAIETETLAGLIPTAYTAKRDNALVLGSGTGVTAGAIGTEFEHLDLVDLSPDLRNQLAYHRDSNHNLLDHPGLETFSGDAHAFVASATDKYSLIFSTVSGAGYAFSAGLYTEDFFRAAKSQLANGGVFGTWMDSRFTGEGAALIYKAFETTFRHTRVFAIHPPERGGVNYQPNYIILLGSDAPMAFEGSESPIFPSLASLEERQVEWCLPALLSSTPSNTPLTLAASYAYKPSLSYALRTDPTQIPFDFIGQCATGL